MYIVLVQQRCPVMPCSSQLLACIYAASRNFLGTVNLSRGDYSHRSVPRRCGVASEYPETMMNDMLDLFASTAQLDSGKRSYELLLPGDSYSSQVRRNLIQEGRCDRFRATQHQTYVWFFSSNGHGGEQHWTDRYIYN